VSLRSYGSPVFRYTKFSHKITGKWGAHGTDFSPQNVKRFASDMTYDFRLCYILCELFFIYS